MTIWIKNVKHKTISLLFCPAEWQHSLPAPPQPQDSPTDIKMHISTISLLFRPAEWQHSLPVMPQPQDSPTDIRSKEFREMEVNIAQ